MFLEYLQGALEFLWRNFEKSLAKLAKLYKLLELYTGMSTIFICTLTQFDIILFGPFHSAQRVMYSDTNKNDFTVNQHKIENYRIKHAIITQKNMKAILPFIIAI